MGTEYQNETRTVMFLAGQFEDLELGGSGYAQLDGVLELLDFAESYVLSDRIAIGGTTSILGKGPISDHLKRLAQETCAVEVIGHGSDYEWDLMPFQDRRKMNALMARLDELGRSNQEHSAEGKRCFEELNLLEARAYILMADALNAAYVPDRLFGVRALEQYSEITEGSEHLQNHEAFRNKLTEQLRVGPNDNSVVTQVPSFLLEALHEARTWEGIFAALSDIRNSTAARHYRNLMLRSRSEDIKERREARNELARDSQSAFKKEGLPGSFNRWIVPTIGLSAPAITFLFPKTAAVIGVALAVRPTIEALRGWLRDRNNLFKFYDEALGSDLYDELVRVFPKVKFHRENLSHFLSKRDFGWSEELDFWRIPRRAIEN
jgi:hypothetical protein